MGTPMGEDIRSFQEFYPSPMRLERVIYSFAHIFLPRFLRENPWRFFDSIFGCQASVDHTIPQRIIQTYWMRFGIRIGGGSPEWREVKLSLGCRRLRKFPGMKL
jgi:hypothetical protein